MSTDSKFTFDSVVILDKDIITNNVIYVQNQMIDKVAEKYPDITTSGYNLEAFKLERKQLKEGIKNLRENYGSIK